MNGRDSDDWLRGAGDRLGFDPERGISALRDALRGLRDSFDRDSGGSSDGGTGATPDLRATLLALLAEAPAHGSQLIAEIGVRTDGAWTPSAGEVYPTLQLLADEGLATADRSSGKTVYSPTEDGREAAAAGPEAPWAQPEASGARSSALPNAGLRLAQAAAQVSRAGTPQQVDDAVAVLDEARRRLYSILAADD